MASTPSGWFPVDIGFDAEAALLPDAAVRWMEFGSAGLDEPFLEHTVKRLRETRPAAREMDTDLETMIRMGRRLPSVQPAGFIFHLSHCGSTLVSNAMKTDSRAVVVSESRPVNRVLRTRSHDLHPYLQKRWEATERALLESLFALFASYRTGQPEPLVIKFVSLDTLAMVRLRSWWPEVPCVVVIRDPVEVMVSNRGAGGWLSFKQHSETAGKLFGWTEPVRPSAEMVDEEYCARILGGLCSAALEASLLPPHGRCKVVDYSELNPGTMREIGRFFGLEVLADAGAEDLVFKAYAKDPGRSVPFHDDRAKKQKLADVLVRSAANQWAADAYARLRKHGSP